MSRRLESAVSLACIRVQDLNRRKYRAEETPLPCSVLLNYPITPPPLLPSLPECGMLLKNNQKVSYTMESLQQASEGRLKRILKSAAVKNIIGELPYPEITEDGMNEIEPLCHSILGNMLMYGWQIGRLDDKESLSLALGRCAYTGMVAAKELQEARRVSYEDLFNKLAANRGIVNWESNALAALGIPQGSKQAITIERLNAAAEKLMAPDMPKFVDGMGPEQLALEACVAMYYFGLCAYGKL